MHDPMTVAFDIKYPWKKKCSLFPDGDYRETFLTVWHVDPEKDGSDDSCGWFMRPRHGNEAMLKQIEKDFDYEWNHATKEYDFGLFDSSGNPKYSNIYITTYLFRLGASIFFARTLKQRNWKKAEKWMNKEFMRLVMFSEGEVDSMDTLIKNKYGYQREQRVRDAARIIYGWLLRDTRPWYKHPRWHIHHWKLQCHPLQSLKRTLFSKCCKCGKGFKYGESVTTDQWNSDGPRWFKSEKDVYHSDHCGVGRGSGCYSSVGSAS